MGAQVLDKSLREVLEAVSDGVCLMTREREIVFWNKGAERITGFSSDDMMNKRCADILAPRDLSGRDLCIDGCPLQRSVETGESQETKGISLKRKDGESTAIHLRTSALDFDGIRYYVQVFGEVQPAVGGTLGQTLQKLASVSITDELTGLYDRRYIDTILDQQYSLFKRHFQRFGVCLIDVDKFKDIHDTFGPLAADETLRSVASILLHSPRSTDFLARFDDSEFIIVCPLIELEGLEQLGERIVGLVHHAVLSSSNGQGPKIEVTVSVGGSMVDYKDKSAADIIARAQEAISRVQRDGGNWYGLG